jgi:hypothetical protein
MVDYCWDEIMKSMCNELFVILANQKCFFRGVLLQ